MLAILFFAASAAALEWWQPDPTAMVQNNLVLDGWTPKPTKIAEMAKRQQIPAQDTICGYLSGSAGNESCLN